MTIIATAMVGAQAAILVVALSAYVLAALFAQRRETSEHLTKSNVMLERERDNKLMNAQAITAAISHELKQPLAAIATSGGAALRFLEQVPPDVEEVRSALKRIVSDSHRTSDVFDGIRALFGKGDQKRLQVDVNEIILGVPINTGQDGGGASGLLVTTLEQTRLIHSLTQVPSD
jgi:C4-dicarboxylate-specific signal transduction histidine kinase